jgi:hypothetical protein
MAEMRLTAFVSRCSGAARIASAAAIGKVDQGGLFGYSSRDKTRSLSLRFLSHVNTIEVDTVQDDRLLMTPRSALVEAFKINEVNVRGDRPFRSA